MKVTILNHTPEPEKTIAAAARLCYSNTSAATLMENFPSDKASSFIKKLMDMGHMSPTEHVSFTFAIDGASRTLLAQLTRHRIASYSVQSLRYNNPFKAELSKEDEEKLLPENLSYLEGIAFSRKTYPKQNDIFTELIQRHDIRGKMPDDIPQAHLPSYFRGIFEEAGHIDNSHELLISFGNSINNSIKQASFNITQKDGKILIKNQSAFNFLVFIYGGLDFINSLYQQEILVNLCKSIPDFWEHILNVAKKYIELNYYATLPETVAKKPEALLIYIKGLQACKENYLELVKLGVNQEDARYILPMGTQTRIVMTMNVRSLYNFFNLRCCNRAQNEIRELANMMLAEVKKIAPLLFEKAGAPCEATGYCPEGGLSCGKYPRKS